MLRSRHGDNEAQGHEETFPRPHSSPPAEVGIEILCPRLVLYLLVHTASRSLKGNSLEQTFLLMGVCVCGWVCERERDLVLSQVLLRSIGVSCITCLLKELTFHPPPLSPPLELCQNKYASNLQASDRRLSGSLHSSPTGQRK